MIAKIRRRESTSIVAALALAMSAACERANPAAPSPLASRELTERPAVVSPLTVSSFALTGWKDQSFHYLPRLSLTLPSDARSVLVQQITFTAIVAGRITPVAGVRYQYAKSVVPGATLDLVADPSLGGFPPIVTSEPLGTVTVTVSYTDDAGVPGSATANADAPEVVAGSIATVTIQSFTVSGSTRGTWFEYWPRLILSETSGASRAIIKQMVFELLPDAGSNGKIPTVWNPAQIPAGGTITLDDDGYGGPWVGISSPLVNASRVSVVISFVDEEGRGGSVSAVADVSR